MTVEEKFAQIVSFSLKLVMFAQYRYFDENKKKKTSVKNDNYARPVCTVLCSLYVPLGITNTAEMPHSLFTNVSSASLTDLLDHHNPQSGR